MNTHEREELPEVGAAHSRLINALAAIVNVHTPDELYDLNAIPRDPVMLQVQRIREASDDMLRAYGRLCRAGRGDAFDPSHPWPGVDSVLVSAFACGENDLEFDMIQARRVINEAFLRRLSPQAGGES